MSALTVVVAGATGKQGGAVARGLLERGHRVRAVTRDPNSTQAKSLADAGATLVTASLEALGYATLPSSGKLRDLAKQLPHIVQTLGCRILHLLPIHPTPTTYARFGRFGSPYAALDLTAVDPALVEFDKRATGIDQFCELTYAAHSLGARVFLRQRDVERTAVGHRLHRVAQDVHERLAKLGRVGHEISLSLRRSRRAMPAPRRGARGIPPTRAGPCSSVLPKS